MSGIRVEAFKKPASIIVDQSKVQSSYGPKSSILLEKLASSWSKSGFTISMKGLSRDALLGDCFITIPIQIRWRGGADGAAKLLPNQFPKENGVALEADGKFTAAKMFQCYDSICVRPNPFKCMRNATLSINGSSFSTRVDSYFTAMSKLFCDGRREALTGCQYERYPYTNSGARSQYGFQKGMYERAKAMDTMGKVVHIAYGGAANSISDIVWQYDIKIPLFFGIFTHKAFPGLSHFDGQSVSSLPYCNDLNFECSFTENVIMDAFSWPDCTMYNALSVKNNGLDLVARNDTAGQVGDDISPNSEAMWKTCIVGDIKDKDTAFVGLLQPRLCYSFAEPNHELMQLQPVYQIPSYRLITYEDRQTIAGGPADNFVTGAQTVRISFPYIRLSNISALYICHAEDARTKVGDNWAARAPKYSGAYSQFQQGGACSNRCLKIDWSTVKVSMSTQSTVLTNHVNNTITPQVQYQLFQKYSGAAMGLTYEQWFESSQMILFSAEELSIGVFGNSFQSLTMSVEFSVYRDAADTKVRTSDYLAVGIAGGKTIDASHMDSTASGLKGQNVNRTVIGRLICLEPEICSISEGALSVEQVRLSNAELKSQLLGGSAEIADEQDLDALAR